MATGAPSNEAAFVAFLQRKAASGQAPLAVEVEYADLLHTIKQAHVERGEATSVTSVVGDLLTGKALRKACAARQRVNAAPAAASSFTVLGGNSGRLRPGTLTLVLAPPGHSKTSFLRAIAHRAAGSVQGGVVRFGGMSPAEALSRGIHVHRLVSMVSQEDVHFPELTVKETLEFAASTMRAAAPAAGHAGDSAGEEVAAVMSMLKLTGCAATQVGDATTRGISGGERRRLSIGEALLTDARVLVLDEPTTGLDAAVAQSIITSLQAWCRLTNGTLVASLLAPTPEMLDLFDDVILLREGCEVYHGPRQEMPRYVAGTLGFIPDGDIGDFVVDLLSDPVEAAAKQRAMLVDAVVQEEGDGEAGATTQPAACATVEDAATGAAASPAAGTGAGTGGTGDDGAAAPTTTASSVVAAGVKTAAVDSILASPLAVAALSGRLLRAGRQVPADVDATVLAKAVVALPAAHMGAVATTSAMTAAWKASDLCQRMLRSSTPATSAAGAVGGGKDASTPSTVATPSPTGSGETGVELVAVTPSADHKPAARSQPLTPSTTLAGHAVAQYGSAYARSLPMLVGLIMARQAKLTGRNYVLLISLMAAGALTALVMGSLFWKLGLDFPNKLGCIFYLSVHLGFQANAEMSNVFAMRPIVTKQVASRMFPPSLFTTAFITYAIPRAVLETLVTTAVLYYMTGFSAPAEQFFLFVFVVFCGCLGMGAWLRLVAFSAKNPETAAALGMPIAVVQCIFGGYLLTRNQIPKWLLGAFWASPFSWTLRALVRIETNDDMYKEVQVAPGVTLGDAFMESFEFQSQQYWIGAGIGFNLAFFLLGVVLTGIAVTIIRQEESVGSSRLAGLTVEDAPQQERPRSPGRTTITISPASHHALPIIPVTFAFRDLRYTVTLPRKAGGGKRILLRGVSGYALPGQVTVMLGASGAGKSTLLDAIAGRKNTGVLTGDVFINGAPKDDKMFARLAAYVEQSDIHSPYLTVMETLQFSATMRLPASVNAHQRASLIEEILSVLDLQDVKHRVVGTVQGGGLSPSQLKRLSIATEMCAWPSLIFLDEPTSGLDSRSALTVMTAIRNLATQLGRTVLVTVHQPSNDVYCMADNLLLLQTGGYEVYVGPMHAAASPAAGGAPATAHRDGRAIVDYMATIPGLPHCPHLYNPATYMLQVLADHPQLVEPPAAAAPPTADGKLPVGAPVDWQGHYKSSAVRRNAEKAVAQLCTPEGARAAVVSDFAEASSPASTAAAGKRLGGWASFATVLRRTNTIYNRNIAYSLGRIFTLLFLGLILGLLYFDVGSSTSYAGVRSKISAIFLSISFGGIVVYTMPLAPLVRERAVVYRERTSHTYNVLHYGLSVLLVELPWIALATIVHVVVMYWMVGFLADAGVFFHYLLVSFLAFTAFTQLGVLFSWALPSQEISQLWGGLLVGMAFIFAGLLIPPNVMPVGWKWVYYVNPVSYALSAVVSPQFHCDAATQSPCPVLTLPDASGSYVTFVISDYIESYFSIRFSDRFVNIGYLAIFVGAFVVLALLSLRQISWIRR